MSKKRYERLEILQDPEAPPKRKRKRKLGPIYISWRWVGASFLGGAAIVGLLIFFGFRPSTSFPVIPDSSLTVTRPTALPAPIPTLTGDGEFLRSLSWVNGRLAASSRLGFATCV